MTETAKTPREKLVELFASLWPMRDGAAIERADWIQRNEIDLETAARELRSLADAETATPSIARMRQHFITAGVMESGKVGEGDPALVHRLADRIRKEAANTATNLGWTLREAVEGHRLQCVDNADALEGTAEAGIWLDRAAACSLLLGGRL